MRPPRASAATPCARLRTWKEIAAAVRIGLRGVASLHRGLVADGRQYSCSVDLDEAFRTAEPRAARWDYILTMAVHAVGMEVHPAKASEVDGVIAKKRWAEQRLAAGCALRLSRWCWIRPPGSRLQFTPLSPQARRLAKSGIEFPRARLEARQ
jgi:hypothetical protein